MRELGWVLESTGVVPTAYRVWAGKRKDHAGRPGTKVVSEVTEGKCNFRGPASGKS